MKISQFFKLTAAMLACVSAIAVTSCDNNDDPKGSGLKFDPAEVAVAPGATATVTVSEGTAPYTLASGDAKIAAASVNDNTITITGVEEGTTTVVVTDAKSLKGEIAVSVSGLGFDKPALSMDVDADETVTITGGESPYIATVENQEIATASVTDDKVAVKGVKAGTTSITVTDKDKKTGTISVTVK